MRELRFSRRWASSRGPLDCGTV